MSNESVKEKLQEGREQLVQQLNNVVAEINRLTAMRDDLIRKIDRQDGGIAVLKELDSEQEADGES